MTNGWDGSDPVQQNDGAGAFYELATRYTANANVTISAIRVWAGTSLNVANRNARIWNTSGTLLRTIDIDDTQVAGWTTYDVSPTLDVVSGASIDVSFSTQQYYGAISGGYPNDSSDGNVTAVQGRFAESIGTYPTNVTATFYGIDIVYSLTGGNQPPDITGMSIAQSGATVQPTVTLTDESPSTVTLNWNWGDGQTTNTGAGVLTTTHDYAASGAYAILVTATDNGGLTDAFAAPVQVTIPVSATDNEEWFTDILDAVVSDVQSTGYFDKVNTHEPKKAPRTQMTAAVWIESIDPIALASTLSYTSARLVFKLRMYQNMLREPQDMIDPLMGKAASRLMRRYHDDFDFEGLVRNIDLLGAYGVALSAISGYLDVDGKMLRIIDMTIPVIVNDVWPQVS